MSDGASIIDDWWAAHRADVVGWRRAIHQQPELSRQEVKTTEMVMALLGEVGLNPTRLPLGTGVVCDLGPVSYTHLTLPTNREV